MKIYMIETLWPEEKNFTLHRDDIGKQYIFLHFLTPVTAILKGESVEIAAGGCVFFCMNSMQHFTSNISALLHDWFHADESCAELMKKYGLECETVYYPDDSDEITRMINEIELEYINKEAYYTEAASAIAEHLFVKLSRAGKKPVSSTGVDFYQKEMFIKARSKIHMDIRYQWKAEEMAELVHLSPSRFYTIYKKIFGITPQQDLIRKRIQMASVLLSKRQMTVEQIAEQTGYRNQYHFIRQFKQITGVTPGKFCK